MQKEELVNKVINAIEKQIPLYLSNIEDKIISMGNVAVCVIDEKGNIYGKMFGEDKIKQRYFFDIAWSKASQSIITNHSTGDFESLVFSGQIDEKQFGIKRHDFIGWKGGQLITLDNVRFAIGFSGFRENSDLEIVVNAINMIE